MTQSASSHGFRNSAARGLLLACLVTGGMSWLRAQERIEPVPSVVSVTPGRPDENATSEATAKVAKEKTDAPQLTYRVPEMDDRYQLGAGDTVLITVFRYPELSRTTRIDGAGTIRLPLIHSSIRATCLTTDELADQIAKLYLDYLKDPQVDVVVRDYSSEPVAVVGAVNKPGSFALQRRVRLRELVAYAGGPAPTAGKLVQILHDTSAQNTCQAAQPAAANPDAKADAAAPAVASPVAATTATPAPPAAAAPGAAETSSADAATGTAASAPNSGAAAAGPDPFLAGITSIDLVALMHGAGPDPFVRPGDVVNIPDADSAFVVGDVYRPSVVPLNKQITVSRAIAIAGGLTPSAKSSKIRIVRYVNGRGGNTQIVINLKDIYANKTEDLALQSGDIVQVPDSTGKNLLKAFAWLGAWWGVYNAYNIIQ